MSEKSVSDQRVRRATTRRGRRVPKPRRIDWRTFDPSSVETDGDDLLIKELMTYQANLATLLEHAGAYVLIKGEEIVGYFPSQADALEAGAERFGNEPALIKEIVEQEEIYPSGGLAD